MDLKKEVAFLSRLVAHSSSRGSCDPEIMVQTFWRVTPRVSIVYAIFYILRFPCLHEKCLFSELNGADFSDQIRQNENLLLAAAGNPRAFKISKQTFLDDRKK